MTEEEFIQALCSASDAQARRALIDGHPDFLHLKTVQALKERADLLERDDAHQALATGLAAEEMAELLGSDEARALACWAQANAYDILAELEPAARYYQ